MAARLPSPIDRRAGGREPFSLLVLFSHALAWTNARNTFDKILVSLSDPCGKHPDDKRDFHRLSV